MKDKEFISQNPLAEGSGKMAGIEAAVNTDFEQIVLHSKVVGFS